MEVNPSDDIHEADDDDAASNGGDAQGVVVEPDDDHSSAPQTPKRRIPICDLDTPPANDDSLQLGHSL